MKWVLVTLCSNDWVEQARQVFASAYFEGKWRDDFCIMGYHLSDSNKQWFLDHGIYVYEVEHIYEKPDRIEYNSSNLLKHNMFSSYFKKWDRVFFLDSDTMCVRNINSIKQIHKEEFILATVAGTTNHPKSIMDNLQKNSSKKLVKIINDQVNIHFFVYNSGSIVFSTKIISESTIQEMKKFGDPLLDVFMGDQVLLSIFWYSRMTKNDFKWNDTEPIKQRDSFVYHFVRESKPWIQKNIFSDKWTENLENSEYLQKKQ